jgi:two-component system, OmpR family, KDP operon response regulator KdpE
MKASRLKRGAPRHVSGATQPPNCAIRSRTPKPADTILVIDCEQQTRRFVSIGLKFYGYSVCPAKNGSVGLTALAHIRPDLVILDPDLLDMSGIGVLRTIRSRSNVPVIVLSIQTEEDHKVRFLRSGADDYVVKPFGMAELAARCEAALRRYHQAVEKDPVVRTGPLTIDLVSRAVTLDSRYVTLTRQEYYLLHLLASHLGFVITHSQLIGDIWGDISPENVQYLRCLVRKLRQKIEADPSQPKLLMSESGIGYRLERHRVDDRSKPYGKMSENSQQLPAEIVRVGENRGVMAREKRSQTKKQRLLRAQHA